MPDQERVGETRSNEDLTTKRNSIGARSLVRGRFATRGCSTILGSTHPLAGWSGMLLWRGCRSSGSACDGVGTVCICGCGASEHDHRDVVVGYGGADESMHEIGGQFPGVTG